MPELLPESTQVLYSELLDELLRGAYSPTGISLFTREVKGRDYWYMQYVVGSSQRSYYLGPDDDELRARVQAAKALWERDAASASMRARLVAMIRAGGATTLPDSHARVLEALEQAGVFLVGGVVIGSHAFALLSNTLGVKWEAAFMRTQDIDIAHDYQIHVTVPSLDVDLQRALEEADKGFLPVPALSRKHPATSFSIRGAQLSVSLLTPMRGAPDSTPQKISSLNAMASPVRFLDYLLHDVQPAALPARHGVLVNIPSPARFALHKLVVSQRRPPVFEVKARKDVAQAQEVLKVLFDARPGDILLAMDAAREMAPKFMTQLQAGMARLDKETRGRLEAMM